MSATKNTGGGVPVGSAGGDLSGSYPSPTVAKSNGRGIVTVLAQTAAPSSVTGTTTKTVLASVSIPAGTLGANGALRITPIWSATNNADAKTVGVQIGSTLFQSASIASQASMQSQIIVRNRNSQQSQVFLNSSTNNGLGALANAPSTSTIDFSQAQTLQFFATLGVSGDTATLEGYTVEVSNP